MKIPVYKPSIGKAEIELVAKAMDSGWVSSKGPYVKQFEEEFAKYCGVKYGVAVNSGTSALHLALLAAGVGPGDEVIVPALTFAATAFAVSYTGATPVFCDIDEYCRGMDKHEMLKKLGDKTKVVIAVHLYGHPSTEDDRKAKHECPKGKYLIEDAAEAHGAEVMIDGKVNKVGSLGHIGCFSFYANKIITTGEGGMCVTDDFALADHMRALSEHMMSGPGIYNHADIGYSYGMTNMQAALGLAQLGRIDEIIKKKRRIAQWYEDRLATLERKGQLTLHPEAGWAKCVYWMYSILVKETAFGESRNFVRDHLKIIGIETRSFFPVLNTLKPYLSNERFPVAERVSAEGMNLPSYPDLAEDEVDYICQAIIKLAK